MKLSFKHLLAAVLTVCLLLGCAVSAMAASPPGAEIQPKPLLSEMDKAQCLEILSDLGVTIPAELHDVDIQGLVKDLERNPNMPAPILNYTPMAELFEGIRTAVEEYQGSAPSANARASALSPQLIDREDIQTLAVDSDFMEWLYGVPEDLRSASTLDLLDYFLKSPFIGQQLYPVSSIFNGSKQKADFTAHEAFLELLSREDFVYELENYAQSIYSSSENIDMRKFELLLQQDLVDSLISASTHSISDYPYLQTIYTSLGAQAIVRGSFVGTLNGINYYSSGTITTASGLSVEVCRPERELTSSEISNFNSAYDYVQNTRLSSPSAYYNCHSYAWYRFSFSNPYWIDSISQFLRDSSCTYISSASVQTRDIIVYFDANGTPIHSGVVYSANSGNIIICSKWGQAGAYLHSITNVPNDYQSSPGYVSYVYYRYHHYSNQYTGQNYHSDISHYYQYADTCKICNYAINHTWKVSPCKGPPCATPWSLTPTSEVF